MSMKTAFLSPYPKEIKSLLQPAILRRLQKEKRGQGYGKDYQPFLTVRDVPSKGRVHVRSLRAELPRRRPMRARVGVLEDVPWAAGD